MRSRSTMSLLMELETGGRGFAIHMPCLTALAAINTSDSSTAGARVLTPTGTGASMMLSKAIRG
jgi:hypothetical protein